MSDILLHRPGQNCWRIETADFASVIVDCANYYRALHESICGARRSVFVLGWDIDSRIELLRGEEAEKAPAPGRFFDLVKWKALRNPEVQFYLNRWDYTLYQAGEREGLSHFRWRFFVPENIHFHLDNMHPVGGCHHQKVVVIDDELAFVGGIDIAIGRWDYRSHHPRNMKRMDPGGTYEPRTRHLFAPHHDIMMMVAGPIAPALGRIARERWRASTGQIPCALQTKLRPAVKPCVWPKEIKEQFTGVPIAISRTLPAFRGNPGVREIERLYIDEIARAENFIYMENQYFTSGEIALALNRQLLAKPGLRVMLVSCDEPQGIMERKAMWAGRVFFRDLLIQNDVADRVLMAYPLSRENGNEKSIRIHSKLTAIDDKILHIGSSNINNRSLWLDTECDLSIAAHTEGARRQIAAIRNDLLREHTGWTREQIEQVVDENRSPEKFLTYRSESRQHLCKIDDEKYRHQSFIKLAIRVGDPKEPFFFWQKSAAGGAASRSSRIGPMLIALTVLAAILALTLVWQFTPASEYVSPTHIAPLFAEIRSSAWAIPAVIAFYVVATLVFFPLTILVIATAITFSPLTAFLIAFGGTVSSACVGFVLGRMAGPRSLRFLAGRAAGKISRFTQDGGIVGVTLLRMVPIAPLGVVDFSLGMAKVPFLTYLAGTIFGITPGLMAFTLLGHSLGRLWQNLNGKNMAILAGGVGVWILVVAMSHYFVKKWRQNREILHGR
ncbi:MAG: VTT domain-containing protein [Bdellovibrionales bacterium]